MPARTSTLAALAVLIVTAGSAAALEAEIRANSYTIQPLPPVDLRNTYIPPQGAAFVIDNLRGEITLCYPDSKDGKFLVTCTAATKIFPSP